MVPHIRVHAAVFAALCIALCIAVPPPARALAHGDVLVTEIMAAPVDGSEWEYVEFHNPSATQSVNIGGAIFTDGVNYTFPPTVQIPPGGYLVLAGADPVGGFAAFRAHYGLDASVEILGPWEGKLNNGGERLRIVSGPINGVELFDVEYQLEAPWPSRADEGGSSLELILPEVAALVVYDDPASWRASVDAGGSPGRAGIEAAGVVINEVFTHTDPPHVDAVELFNPTASRIDVGGWFLSDSASKWRKFRIPDGTALAPGAYLVFDETDFNPTPLTRAPEHFAFSSAHGEEAVLVRTNAVGEAVAFEGYAEFPAAANGEPFGRWPNGEGFLYPMPGPTLGAANGEPRVGPVVITEIHYHPADGTDAGALEFVEVHNPTNAPVDLTNWRLADGVEYIFPPARLLASGATCVVVSFDPEAAADAEAFAAFRAAYALNPSVSLLGPYSGQLSNGGERIALLRPDSPPMEEPEFIPLLTEDQVRYGDAAPWPPEADGEGRSLHRAATDLFGDDPYNWIAAAPSPGMSSGPEAVPPAIRSLPPSAALDPGDAFSYRVEVDGVPRPKIQVSGAPPWLAFDGYRTLSGVVAPDSTTVQSAVRITAKNRHGEDAQEFELRTLALKPGRAAFWLAW